MMARESKTQVVTPYPELTLDTAWHGESHGNGNVVYIGEGADRKQLIRLAHSMVHPGSRAHFLGQADHLVMCGAEAFGVPAINQTLQEQSQTMASIRRMVETRVITHEDARPIITGADKVTGELRALRTARILHDANLLQEFIHQEEGPWVQVYSEKFHLNPEEIGAQGGLVRSRLLQLADVYIEAPEDTTADVLPTVTALFRDEAGMIGTFVPDDPIVLFGRLTPYAD